MTMLPHFDTEHVTIWHGDCIDVMRGLPDASVDAVVTDPPYGLEFMGKDWDSFKTYAGGNPAMKPQGANVGGDPSAASYGYRQKNPRCRNCGKLQRGNGACKCPAPSWDTRTSESAFQFQAWTEDWATEAFRLLKPGGHLLAFGGTRTFHRLTAGIEDAGFEIRDSIAWLYGSGFPKSLNVEKAIEAHLTQGGSSSRLLRATEQAGDGAPYELTGRNNGILGETRVYDRKTFAAGTDEARAWAGYGTALKPAFEPIVVARKPLSGTVAANVLAYGTGVLNIDASRIGTDGGRTVHTRSAGTNRDRWEGNEPTGEVTLNGGRWPANVVLDASQAAALDQQSGVSASRKGTVRASSNAMWGRPDHVNDGTSEYDDEGGASRFFKVVATNAGPGQPGNNGGERAGLVGRESLPIPTVAPNPPFMYTAKAGGDERPVHWKNSCDCEDAWPTTSHGRATAARTTADASNTTRSGSSTTGPSPTATRSTTSTTTSSTTGSRTSSPSPRPTTNASTPDASSATASGGSPAASATSSNPSDPLTGTSAAKAGPSTAAAVPATSHEWFRTSVCGSCGAPAKSEAHATVKPVDLMRWLVKLVTPKGGTVLEPFAGSGTTVEAAVLEGFRCIAIEREADYLPLIMQRVSKPHAVGLDFGDWEDAS